MKPKQNKERFQRSNSHANLINLVQNTNELYINTSHNLGSKITQKISHNHIKSKEINHRSQYKNVTKQMQLE